MGTYNGSDATDIWLGTGDDDTVTNIGVGLDVITTGGGSDTVTVVPDGGGLLDILPDVISMGIGADDHLIIDYRTSTDALNLNQPILDLEAGFSGGLSLGGLEALTFLGVERFTVYGGSAADRITTGSGDDVINGGGGADVMDGGAGDDTYYVNSASDQIVEAEGGGSDKVFASVSYTLQAGSYVQGLTLTGGGNLNGTGNGIANRLEGNSGDNVLRGMAGDDRLDGKAGADTLYGGTGDDTFYVDDADDRVVELANQGHDIVYASVNYALQSGSYVQELILTGSASEATGNSFQNWLTGNAGSDVLTGLGGRDFLDGKAGADIMIGGTGGDTYYVDDSADQIIELKGGGVDVVYASVDYALQVGSYVQRLYLTGSADLDATGNGIANRLVGNAGENVLTGGGGGDQLTGGAGADVFRYTALKDSTVFKSDVITDLSDNDMIDLSAIDANTGQSGDQAFQLVDSFSNTAGQITLDYSSVTGLTTLLADVNGDGVADMQIFIEGNHETFRDFGW